MLMKILYYCSFGPQRRRRVFSVWSVTEKARRIRHGRNETNTITHLFFSERSLLFINSYVLTYYAHLCAYPPVIYSPHSSYSGKTR